jgi:hypothetical protein
MTIRPILLLSLLLSLAACAQTEQQRYGYQTADLIARADQIGTASPDVAHWRHAYNVAVVNGDRMAMRSALDELNKAEKAWGGK